MRRQLLLLFVSLVSLHAYSQDMISVRKKNGRTLKTFMAGVPIVFETTDGRYVEGPIKAIRNDSIYVTIYDIRTVFTSLGVYVRDTIAVYNDGYAYKDIKRIKLFKYHHYFANIAGSLLEIGGTSYFTLNLINGAYLHQSVTSKSNLKKIGASVGAFGLGFLIHKLFSGQTFSNKRDKIIYLKLTPGTHLKAF